MPPNTLFEIPPSRILPAPANVTVASVTGTAILANTTYGIGNVVPENGDAPIGLAFDAGAGRLYVATGGGAIVVMSGATEQVINVIPTGSGLFGIAFDSRDGKIFASHRGHSNVTIVDAATGKVSGSIQVGVAPAGIFYDPVNGQLYVMDSGASQISVVDGSRDVVVATVNVGIHPYYMTMDSATNRLFVTNSASSNLTVINGSSDRVLASFSVGTNPAGVVFDPVNGDLFVVDSGTGIPPGLGDVSVLNAISGKTITTIPIGVCPWGAALDEADREVYVADTSCSTSGEVRSISTTNFSVQTVGYAGQYPIVPLFDGSTGRVYVANEFSDNVSILNGSSGLTIGSIGSGMLPAAVAIDPSDGYAFVSEMGGNRVEVIDASTRDFVAAIGPFAAPTGLAFNPSLALLYVADSFSSRLSIVDAQSLRILGSIPVGLSPQGVAYDSANGEIFVANCGSHDISAVDSRTYSVVATFPGGLCPSQVLFDPANSHVYVSDRGPNIGVSGVEENVTVIDANRNTLVTEIVAGGGPEGIALNPSTGLIYVANWVSSNITVIDGRSDRPVGSIGLGGQASPVSLAYDPSNDQLYIGLAFFPPTNSVVVVNLSDDRIVGSVTVGLDPIALAYQPTTSTVIALNWLSGTLSLIQPMVQSAPRFLVSVLESGLRGGLTWWVNLSTGSSFSTNSRGIAFYLDNGTYDYLVATSDKTLAAPAGRLMVSGSPESISVEFNSVVYNVSFDRSNLPASLKWSVHVIGNSTQSGLGGIVFPLGNGTYSFVLGSVPGWTTENFSGRFTVEGIPLGFVISWLPEDYSLTFVESGPLPVIGWSVSLGFANSSSAPAFGSRLATIAFPALQNGTYRYTISVGGGYVANPRSGEITITGSNVTLAIQVEQPPVGLPLSEIYLIMAGGAVGLSALGVALAAGLRAKASRTRARRPTREPPSVFRR
ncbi:MAG TPA: hypothetical protein VGX00_00020 [Thermoplasmata archaeon]|nr:hypothetical protein [Thermoplasmata archaeon]